MKALFATLALALSLFSFSAQAEQVHTQVELVGTIEANQSYTVTCMAIGCPPSQPYFEGVLVLENGEKLTLVGVQSAYGVTEMPVALSFGQQLVPVGAKVLVKADLTELTNIQYRYIGNVKSIEILQ